MMDIVDREADAERPRVGSAEAHAARLRYQKSDITCCEGCLLVELYSTLKYDLDAIISGVVFLPLWAVLVGYHSLSAEGVSVRWGSLKGC